MPNGVEIQVDAKKLPMLLKELSDPKSFRKAVVRSIKRTVPSLQRLAFSEFKTGKVLRLKASELSTRARMFYNIGSGTPVNELYGKLWLKSKPESLGRFFPRRIRAGRSTALVADDLHGGWRGVQLYSVKVNTFGAPYISDPSRTFMVSKGSSGPVVYQRTGSKRLPIKKLFGPDVSSLSRSIGLDKKLVALARVRFDTEMKNNLNFFVSQATAKANAVKSQR